MLSGNLCEDDEDGGQDCELQRRNEGTDEEGLDVSQEAIDARDPPLKAFNSGVGVGRHSNGGGERKSKRARQGGGCL